MPIKPDTSDLRREREIAASLLLLFRERAWIQLHNGALNLAGDVKRRMPVDTGRARDSWGRSARDGIWQADPVRLTILQGSTVEYVRFLNDGSSTQAPAGFVDAAAESAADDIAGKITDELMRTLT